MNCEEFEGKLADYVAEHLAGPEREIIAVHLSECASCRDFSARIRKLYQIEVPVPDAPAPGALFRGQALPEVDGEDASADDATGTDPRTVLPGFWLRTLKRVAALILLSLFAVYVFHLSVTRYRMQTEQTAWQPLPLLPLHVTLPPLPRAYAEGVFVESRQEAELLASYSGKPLLEQYVHPHCPRCIAVMDAFSEPASQNELRDFVWHREPYTAMPEEWAAEWPDQAMIPFSLPSIRVRSEGCATEPVWQVSRLQEISELVDAWRERCPEEATRKETPLDRNQFEHALGVLRSVPELVERGRVADAVRSLEELERLEVEHRTAFSAEARKLLAVVLAELEEELERIAKLRAGSATERAQARDLAQRLRERVRGLPIEERIVAFCE